MPRFRPAAAIRVDRGGDRRMAGIAEQAGSARHVVRADRDRIDAGNVHEGVEIVQRGDILDLRHDEDRVIGAGLVGGEIAIIVRRAARTEAAPADRRIAAGLDQGAALGRSLHHRGEDALDAEVERLLDADMVVPRDADDRDGIGAVQGHDRGLQGLQIPGAVLGVDDDVVEARDRRRSRRQPDR